MKRVLFETAFAVYHGIVLFSVVMILSSVFYLVLR